MPAAVNSAFGRLAAQLKAFTLGQKVLAIIGVLVLGLGAAGLTMWLTAPKYVPMFSGLSSTDAAAIVDQLTADGVSYQIGDGGSSILVPQADVYTERMKAASAGLPSSDSGGYSLLDDMGVTTSEFQQSVTYQRAVEGELAKTIQGIKGVSTASVKLAMPKDSVFVSEKQDTTASVFVATSGAELSSEQVQAIINLVSASVPGMSAENVAVIDSSGAVLSAVGQGAGGSAADQASDYEGRIESSVQTMLDRVLGAGKSTVVVTADVSAATGQRQSETYEVPEGAPVLTENTSSETYGNGATGADANSGAGGVVGIDESTTTATNVADSGTTTGTGSDSGYLSQSTNNTNALNKVVETTTIPGGEVTRQTVSVAVDSTLPKGVTLADIQSLVTTAAGIDTARGDQITVAAVPFDTSGATAAADALKEAQAAESSAGMTTIITTAITAGGIILAVVIGLILIGKMLRRPAREAIDLGEIGVASGAATLPLASVGGGNPMASLLAAADGADGADAMPLFPGQSPLTPSGSEPAAIPGRARAEVSSFAQRDPGLTAELLRSMIDEPVRR